MARLLMPPAAGFFFEWAEMFSRAPPWLSGAVWLLILLPGSAVRDLPVGTGEFLLLGTGVAERDGCWEPDGVDINLVLFVLTGCVSGMFGIEEDLCGGPCIDGMVRSRRLG
jgi:hypothetical protein